MDPNSSHLPVISVPVSEFTPCPPSFKPLPLIDAWSFQGVKLLFSLPKERPRIFFSSSHEKWEMSPYRSTKHVFSHLFISEHDTLHAPGCLKNKILLDGCEWQLVSEPKGRVSLVETKQVKWSQVKLFKRNCVMVTEKVKTKGHVKFVTFHQATGTDHQLCHQWRVHRRDHSNIGLLSGILIFWVGQLVELEDVVWNVEVMWNSQERQKVQEMRSFACLTILPFLWGMGYRVSRIENENRRCKTTCALEHPPRGQSSWESFYVLAN